MAQIRRTKGEKARQVSFSKRRFDLFEKASELAMLCGVEVAIVGFSPAGKAYSFGHPSVEAILERFAPSGVGCGGGGGVNAGEYNRKLAELCRRYEELMVMVAMEKARKERLDAAMAKERAEAVSPVVAWLEADIRDLGEEELMAYDAALAKVQAALKNYSPNMDIQIQEQMRTPMEIPPSPGFPPFRHGDDAAAGVRLPGPY